MMGDSKKVTPDANDCPGLDALKAYVFGDLPESKIDGVAQHSSHCPACQTTLNRLETSTDDVIQKLRAAALIESTSADETLNRSIEQAQRLIKATELDDRMVAPQELPTQLAQYRILEEVGAGGMGVVYKAQHVRLQKTVALKVISPQRVDRKSVERFNREMLATGQIEHRNIVRATDAGEHAGHHYLVMEFIDGVDLSTLLALNGPVSVADSCEIIRQTSIGLEHAHQLGVVHRDLKPSNLMISSNGEVKILDLGLARFMWGDSDESLTDEQCIPGTADYVSPEQASPGASVDGRTDIYALGCTLYALLAGHAPFHGTDFDSPIKKIVAHLQLAAPDLRETRGDLPAELVRIIEMMIAKSPDDRYSSAADVANQMQAFTNGSDLAALARRAQRLEGESFSDAAVTPGRPASSARSSGAVRRHQPIAIVAIGLLLTIGAVWFAMTVHYRRNHARLAIAISGGELESNATIVIDPGNNQIVITDPDEPLWLSIGEHTYEVRNDSQSLKAGGFTVVRSEQSDPQVLSIELTPARTALHSTVDALLSIGATIVVHDAFPNGSWSSISHRLDDLPAAASDWKWDFQLENYDGLTDETAEQISQLPALNELRMKGTLLDGNQLSILVRSPTLRNLFLDYTGLSNGDLHYLVECHRLEVLVLDGNLAITDVRPLTAMRSLLEIHLNDTGVTNEGLVGVVGLNQLELIGLNGTGVTEDALQSFPTSLQTLGLAETTFTDRLFDELHRFQRLRYLYLEGTEITDDGLKRLPSLPFFEELYMERTRITAAGLETLLSRREHPRLSQIKVTNTTVSANDAARLAESFDDVTIVFE